MAKLFLAKLSTCDAVYVDERLQPHVRRAKQFALSYHGSQRKPLVKSNMLSQTLYISFIIQRFYNQSKITEV